MARLGCRWGKQHHHLFDRNANRGIRIRSWQSFLHRTLCKQSVELATESRRFPPAILFVAKLPRFPEQSQCRNSAARRMVLLVEVPLLRAAARKWITKAAKVPNELPKTANSTLWVVYENANPATLIAWREPRAKASCVAPSDRRRLGATTPAMNKVNATSISSRASEKTFCLFIVCLFIVFAFSFTKDFQRTPFVTAWIWLSKASI